MRYFETRLTNSEKEEIIIRPVYAPIMVRLEQSHYGFEKYVLFPGDVARLNAEGLEEGSNFYYWKQDGNYYSIDNHFRFSIVYRGGHLYLFKTGLHEGYLDDTQLVLVEEVSSETRILELRKVLRYAYEIILGYGYGKGYTDEDIVEDIALSNILIKPRKIGRNEDFNKYFDEVKEYIRKN